MPGPGARRCRDGEDVAVRVPRKRVSERHRATSADDPLWHIVGISHSDGRATWPARTRSRRQRRADVAERLTYDPAAWRAYACLAQRARPPASTTVMLRMIPMSRTIPKSPMAKNASEAPKDILIIGAGDVTGHH